MSLSLPVAGALQDLVLELHNSNGAVLQSNDNWKTGGQQAEIIATAVPPTDDREWRLCGRLLRAITLRWFAA
jgi:hypothetical protein